MPEFRSLFDLPPSVLSRADLEALAKMLEDGVPTNPHSVEYTAKRGHASYRAKSIGDLFNQLPDTIDEVDFRINGWNDDQKIDRGVSIRLHPIASSCQIHSLDEVWFRGRIAQINDFFTERRPWYASVRPYISSGAGVLQAALLLATAYLLFNGKYVWAALAAATFVTLIVATIKFIKGALLPVSRIALGERPGLLNRDALMVIFTAVGAVATLVGVVIQALPKPPQ